MRKAGNFFITRLKNQMLVNINNSNQKLNDFNFDGKVGSMSRRKLAEICGVNDTSIRDIIKSVAAGSVKSKWLETFKGQSFEGTGLLPDLFCAALIKHYAFNTGKEQAQLALDAFAAIGIREWIKKESGYQEQTVHRLPQTYLEALKALVASEEDKLNLQAKIEADAPKVAFAEAVGACDNESTLSDYLRSVGIGRNTGFEKLRELGIIMKSSRLPYQKYLDKGYFKVTTKVVSPDKQYQVTLVTPRGQLWLHERLNYQNALAKTEVFLESQLTLF